MKVNFYRNTLPTVGKLFSLTPVEHHVLDYHQYKHQGEVKISSKYLARLPITLITSNQNLKQMHGKNIIQDGSQKLSQGIMINRSFSIFCCFFPGRILFVALNRPFRKTATTRIEDPLKFSKMKCYFLLKGKNISA